MKSLITTLNIIVYVNCIWPPEYKVDLKQEEEFVISELLDRSDVQDVYDEEELIREEDLNTLKLRENSKKYFRLHHLTEERNLISRRNKEAFFKNPENKLNSKQIFPEFNPHLDESKPWVAGFVDENNNIIKDEDTIYFDDEAKSNKTSVNFNKRNAENDSLSSDYDYNKLKANYDDSVKKAELTNETAKYREIKEEEKPDEVVKSLIDFAPRNCSEEEKTGMGFGAIKCFYIDARSKHLQKDQKFYMVKKIFLITMIWILVYCSIALPLWCQYGWCCCCCRFKICHPRDEIEEIKMFYENNPPGVYRDKEGNLKKYKATTYETYAQRNLEKAIQRL